MINKKEQKKKEIFIICDNIRSAHNIGSIFRTAEAAGVDKIFLCGVSPAPMNNELLPSTKAQKEIKKTALGAEKIVHFESRKQITVLIKKLKNKGFQIIALEDTKDSLSFWTVKPKNKLALILGNEISGISPKILKFCDKIIKIPMSGKKESLNVAVAFGIAIYEIIKN